MNMQGASRCSRRVMGAHYSRRPSSSLRMSSSSLLVPSDICCNQINLSHGPVVCPHPRAGVRSGGDILLRGDAMAVSAPWAEKLAVSGTAIPKMGDQATKGRPPGGGCQAGRGLGLEQRRSGSGQHPLSADGSAHHRGPGQDPASQVGLHHGRRCLGHASDHRRSRVLPGCDRQPVRAQPRQAVNECVDAVPGSSDNHFDSILSLDMKTGDIR